MNNVTLKSMILGKKLETHNGPLRVIVAGSRKLNDYGIVKYILDKHKPFWGDFEIVSGGSYGADNLGERWSKENGKEPIVFPYESKFGKAGGPIRNEKMAKYGDVLIAFWDGESTGTNDMINKALKYNVETYVYEYNK